jgi:hypothetical protein
LKRGENVMWARRRCISHPIEQWCQTACQDFLPQLLHQVTEIRPKEKMIFGQIAFTFPFESIFDPENRFYIKKGRRLSKNLQHSYCIRPVWALRLGYWPIGNTVYQKIHLFIRNRMSFKCNRNCWIVPQGLLLLQNK